MAFPSFGRNKAVRHRPDEPAAETSAPGHELESYLAALTPETDAERTLPGTRRGDTQVHELRLSADADAQLRELASLRDTSPQALAQEWFMQRLAWEADQELGR